VHVRSPRSLDGSLTALSSATTLFAREDGRADEGDGLENGLPRSRPHSIAAICAVCAADGRQVLWAPGDQADWAGLLPDRNHRSAPRESGGARRTLACGAGNRLVSGSTTRRPSRANILRRLGCRQVASAPCRRATPCRGQAVRRAAARIRSPSQPATSAAEESTEPGAVPGGR
jgi:hypothetical protein